MLRGLTWQTVPLLLLAILLHPIMGLFGVFFCIALGIARAQPVPIQIPSFAETTAGFAVVPFAWLFARPAGIWLETLKTRHWFRLYSWTWYEWLGAVGPLVILSAVGLAARKRGEINLSRFAGAAVGYGAVFLAASMIVLAPGAPSGMGTLEPMRFLHLIYIFLALIGGAYLGRHVLGVRLWRWAVFLLLANGGMFLVQRQLFASSEHLEMPGRPSGNQWLQAFAWIRENTPKDAYFALNPHYLAAPGEDYHGFRALAERSALSDAIKDTSVVTKVPELGAAWQAQQDAQRGWPAFRIADFERLRADEGVDWVVITLPSVEGLDCRWHNDSLAVCRIP
jgi:hypothetical protein